MLSARTWAVVVAGGVSDKVDGVGHYGEAVLVTEPASYKTVILEIPHSLHFLGLKHSCIQTSETLTHHDNTLILVPLVLVQEKILCIC